MEAQRRMVEEAARHLCQGKVVAVPAPSGTALLAPVLSAEGMATLAAASTDTAPITAVLTQNNQAIGWLPGLDQRGRRLTRRCWPGEVTIRFTQGWHEGLWQQLPETTRQSFGKDGTLAAQLPPPGPLLKVAQMVPLPLAAVMLPDLPSTMHSQAAIVVPRTAQEQPPQPGATLTWDGRNVAILDPGTYPPEQLRGLTDLVILFLCSGNTCRSPMAEAICRTLLAEQLGCNVAELAQRSIHVMSAGLSAGSGGMAAPAAVVAAQAYGADLSTHTSQPLSLALLQDADYIFAMTQQHMRSLAGRVPAGTCLETLSPEGLDVQDPFGADQTQYNACAVEIHQHLHAHLPRLLAEAQAGGVSPQTPAAAGGEL